MLSTKIRTVIISLAAACSFAGASVVPTVAQAKEKSGGKEVTCEGGAKPGDIDEIKIETKRNGKTILTGTKKEVCGKDGKWHPARQLPPPPPGVVAPVGTVQGSPEVSPSRPLAL